MLIFTKVLKLIFKYVDSVFDQQCWVLCSAVLQRKYDRKVFTISSAGTPVFWYQLSYRRSYGKPLVRASDETAWRERRKMQIFDQ